MTKTILLALMACATAARAEPVAISCTGTQTSEMHDGKKSRTSEPATRVYVIDDEARTLSFYNPNMGTLVPLCAGSEGCSVDFSPHMVGVIWSHDGDTINVSIDRRAGTYWQLSDDVLMMFQFKATCSQTAMPHADLSQNRF